MKQFRIELIQVLVANNIIARNNAKVRIREASPDINIEAWSYTPNEIVLLIIFIPKDIGGPA